MVVLKLLVIYLPILKPNRQYFINKARIDKRANTDVAYKIQVYNNNLIDKYVESYDDNNPTKPTDAMLWAELDALNKPSVYRNYQRIINSKYTSNENLFKLLIKNKANQDLNRIVETELMRINKNLNYVEQAMRTYNITLQAYNDLLEAQRNRSVANRKNILEEVARQANELLVNEGLNIPSSYTYRDLDLTAETLARQSQMASNRDLHLAENEQHINEGFGDKYTQHEWIWTGSGKTTRHASNHLQKRKIDEPFVILNDITFTIDNLMYPGDPNGSPDNVIICYCYENYI